MINYRTWAITKREIRQQVFSKRFIFTTLALPLFMLVIFGFQFLFQSISNDDGARLHVFAESAGLLSQLQEGFEEEQDDSGLILNFTRADAGEVNDFIAANRSAILSGEIDGIVFVPDSALQDKAIFFYSNNAGNQALLNRIRGAVNNALLGAFIAERNLDTDMIDFVRRNVAVESSRVTEAGTEDGGRGEQQIVAMFFTFSLYISLLMISAPVMGAVNEEKVSKVVEVVLSSVSSAELMAGKIVGSACAGFLQILIWMLAFLALLSASMPLLLALGEINLQISFFMFGYFMLNYLIGVLIFLSIFSAFGAMFDNPQDAQSSMFPVMLLVIVPFILSFTVVNNPASTLGELSSMLPFASILVLPARMVLIDVPLWQFGVAILVNLATLYVVILLCGKIYRFTILMTGKRPSWKEIYKWLRYE